MIHIKDDWYIEVDEYTYNLQQYAGSYVDKKGETRENYKNVTYHSTLADALMQYTRYRVRDSLKNDIEIIDAIKTLKHELKSVREDICDITEGM